MKTKQNTMLILGGTGTIGLPIVEHFLTQGWNVISLSRLVYKTNRLENVINKYKEELTLFETDITEEEQLVSAFSQILRQDCTINLLINCVGGLCHEETITNITVNDIHNVFNLNIISIINSCRIFIPLLTAGSVIMNFSGGGAIADQSNGQFILYPCAKTAVLRFTEILANQLVNQNINVFAIDPGWVPSEEEWDKITKDNPDNPYICKPSKATFLIDYLFKNNTQILSGRLYRAFDDYENIIKKIKSQTVKEDIFKLRLISDL